MRIHLANLIGLSKNETLLAKDLGVLWSLRKSLDCLSILKQTSCVRILRTSLTMAARYYMYLYPPPDGYTPVVDDVVFMRPKSAKEVGKVGTVVALAEETSPDTADEDAVKPTADKAKDETANGDASTADALQSPAKKKRKKVKQRAIIKLTPSNQDTSTTTDSTSSGAASREVSSRPSRLVKVYTHHTIETQQSKANIETTILITPDTANYRILAASQVCRGDHVLEIGCSTGECTAILARYVSWADDSTSSSSSNKKGSGSIVAFDTGENMINTARERIESLEEQQRIVKFHKVDALNDPKGAFAAATSSSSSTETRNDDKSVTKHPDVIFIDIGGNRELNGVVRMISWVMDAFDEAPPRLVVVKSKELATVSWDGDNMLTPVKVDGNGCIRNGSDWFAKLASHIRSTSGDDSNQKGKGRRPPKYAHPIKAPLSLSPVDDATPICRFHNYHPGGCKKGDECDFDHVHCHWCRKPGHVARNCNGEDEDELFDFTSTTLKVVNCHAEGEVGDVIVSGISGNIPGDTLWEKSRYIARDERLRNYVLQEPRGGVFRHVNLLVKPIHPDAKVGFIIMEPEDTPPMSGSNSICVATVALETGVVPIMSNEMKFAMEAPGGLVNVTAKCSGGKATEIKVTNVPSFAGPIGATLEVEGIGSLTVDVAYGGDSFVICNAEDLGFKITPEEASDLVSIGMKITRAANEQLNFVHPTNKDMSHFSFTMIAKPIFYENGVAISHTAVAIQPGKIDRCPTGTGCSARLALLHAKGELKLGDRMIGKSIIGSEFHCCIEEELVLNDDVKAIRPSVSGRAWITGTTEHRLDPTDPYPIGYRLTDTWPKKLW